MSERAKAKVESGDDLQESSLSNVPSMAELAYTDSLTGMANRRRLEDVINALILDRADDPAPFSVGILDLDGFKPINDLFGHAAGDNILKQIARRLNSCMPEGALAARLGGDEFAFVLPMVFNDRSAMMIGEAIRDLVSAPFDLGDRIVQLSGSLGFAIHPFGGDDFPLLMNSADTALYRSKKNGRSQVTIYSTAVEKEMKRVTQIEQALRQAIVAGEVNPHFQPIVNNSDSKVVGFEALARWSDPELGPIGPDIFVPIAEERGFVASLSESLLTQAATTALQWPEDIFLSFNLSPMELLDPLTGDYILKVIRKVGLPPNRLELEITETAIIRDPKTADKIVTQLRAEGIGISLDDFGVGQSSLGRLRNFEFDKLKIDRSFIASIEHENSSVHIVKAIIDMCSGLNLDVVAEGIENPNQVEVLRGLGCQSGQGYFYSKAMSAEKTLPFLER